MKHFVLSFSLARALPREAVFDAVDVLSDSGPAHPIQSPTPHRRRQDPYDIDRNAAFRSGRRLGGKPHRRFQRVSFVFPPARGALPASVE
ncbi:hypothetical protein VNO80_25566 [Phaseolus coccineus]|uniref:Uncharacterized protein n=1 Tax=Phaseolus coccineus TaxID=3886 RepID=A0AAN9LUG2_PHACN